KSIPLLSATRLERHRSSRQCNSAYLSGWRGIILVFHCSDTNDVLKTRRSTMTASENPSGAPPHYLDVHGLVRPNKVALICGERSLTYAGLNARTRRVTNALSNL